MKKFRMKRDSTLESKAVAGTIVYDYAYHDYGLANDDSRVTGIEHKSVTLDPAGEPPSFTVPKWDLEEIKD